MKKKTINRLLVICYLAGALIFMAPDIYTAVVQAKGNQAIEQFEQAIGKTEEGTSKTKGENGQTETAESAIDTQALMEAMQKYNEKIYESGQAELTDPWSCEQTGIDLDSYGVNDGTVAVIRIPKMDVELPVYAGASMDNMAKGATVIGQTSLPTGGENTNCVIAAHRGYRGNAMFREIERLQIGDQLTIENCKETLKYQVSDIRIIMPDDIESILIQKGKDMVTLFTCHPYTKSYRRYVVFCERVTDENTNAGEQLTEALSSQKDALDANDAETVRKEAQSEDASAIRTDLLMRKAGYVILAALGIIIFAFCKRKS